MIRHGQEVVEVFEIEKADLRFDDHLDRRHREQLECHAVEDFPCTNLLVGSMTWTWSSWDRHRVYRWNCGVGDGSPCQSETQTHHHSTRI